MEIKCGNQKLEAYPVEPFIYEVVANGKKEFYQAPWDAFRSDLHMNNINAKIIRIPVIPISDDEIEAESIAFELGKKRYYPATIKEFENDKPKIDTAKSKFKITFSRMMDILAIVAWVMCIATILVTLFLSRRN